MKSLKIQLKNGFKKLYIWWYFSENFQNFQVSIYMVVYIYGGQTLYLLGGVIEFLPYWQLWNHLQKLYTIYYHVRIEQIHFNF